MREEPKSSLKGPEWLLQTLSETAVTDLCINGSHVFVDRGKGLEALHSDGGNPIIMSIEELRTWVLNTLASVGKTWDAKNPFVDFLHPSGLRFHIAFPPLNSKGILVSIRKLPWALDPTSRQSITSHWERDPFFAILSERLTQGDTVILSGATGSGKTTLANTLLSHIPSHERILALEDTPELHPEHPHFLSLQSRTSNADGFGEVSLREILRQTLRMRPDRVVLGECRGSEVMELLQLLNTGHQGALCTLHANSGKDALRRLELLCLLASKGEIPSTVIRELISVGVRLIAHLKRTPDGRRISEVLEIAGREGDTLLTRPILAAGQDPPVMLRSRSC